MEIQNISPKLPQTTKEMEAFIGKYQDKFVNHAFYRLGNRQDAEDIVQEVFIKIYAGRAQNRGIGNAGAYAWRMLTNACISELRTRSKNNKVALDEVKIGDMTSQNNKEAEIIQQEDFIRINRLLETLPFEQADVLRFHFMDELSFTEVASILGLPVTTVKSRFKYGLDKVKTKFFNQKEVIHAM